MSLPRRAVFDSSTCQWIISEAADLNFGCFGGSTLGGGGLVVSSTDPLPGAAAYRLAFVGWRGVSGGDPGDIWSSLDTPGTLTKIKSGVQWSGSQYAGLDILRLALGDVVDAVIYLEESPISVRRIDYDGSNDASIFAPGGATMHEPALMTIFPTANTQADIAFWYTSRRGWTPLDGVGAANWGTNNFGVNSMAAHQASGVEGMIVFNTGSNPFDKRNYKTGEQIISTTGNFNGAIKGNRDRTKVFGINGGDFYSINLTTLAETNLFTLPGTANGLVGVNLQHIYYFDIFGGGNFLTRCDLLGGNREVLEDLDALSIEPSLFSGVLY